MLRAGVRAACRHQGSRARRWRALTAWAAESVDVALLPAWHLRAGGMFGRAITLLALMRGIF